MKNPELSRCSMAARGLWIEILCLSFECEERGVFISGGVPWPKEDVAAACRGDHSANLLLLQELLTKGVAKIDKRGAIFSARMVRDEEIRKIRSESGEKGGRPTVSEKQNESKTKAKHEAKAKQIPEDEYEEEVEDEKKSINFDIFWSLYPKKIAKDNAIRSWNKINPSPELFKKIIDSLKIQIKSDGWRTDCGKFIPYPATWLNGMRWEDDVSPAYKLKSDAEIKAERSDKWAAAGKSRCHGSSVTDGRCDSCLQKQIVINFENWKIPIISR